jgi:hypothetical protein
MSKPIDITLSAADSAIMYSLTIDELARMKKSPEPSRSTAEFFLKDSREKSLLSLLCKLTD